MHRPILSFVVCATLAGCARTGPAAEAPAPAPSARESATPSLSPLTRGTVDARDVAPDSPAARPGQEREFRGAYTRGFEASWFAPCDAPRDDALWWVTLTETARLERDSLLATITRPPTGALAVRWRGTISARMPAGQMGRGTRYLLVTQVLEVRPLPPEGACFFQSRSS